jgi:hypothetical protein
MARTLETLRKLKHEAMKHPHQRPGVAPTDFHLKEALARRLQYDKGIKNAVHQRLCALPNAFSYDGIKKLD